MGLGNREMVKVNQGRTRWGSYKLTPEQRREIRVMYERGVRPDDIASVYGIHSTTVTAIGNGKGSYGRV